MSAQPYGGADTASVAVLLLFLGSAVAGLPADAQHAGLSTAVLTGVLTYRLVRRHGRTR
ncbi:hypothetical protein Drose_16845 [Dactylosporangium roseum]|uniref:Uncharacterized protein n=1 Tax=Dactylosporangium roseum TaxID=47989 RepID=A0ABY5ZHJ7_9ACTN|nr:hypothetical protein [Dactylosporangium roseum]UWZ33431.1 hypothetical protein Drose_19105 [Dactylosporangium roseum]UWZ39734.1 hypothetical protein Drose_16845 [Dactylosporangium roseum]